MDLSVRKRQVYLDKIQNETRMNLSEQTDGLSNWLCKKKVLKRFAKSLRPFRILHIQIQCSYGYKRRFCLMLLANGIVQSIT